MKLSLSKLIPIAALFFTVSLVSCGEAGNANEEEYSEEMQDTVDDRLDENDNPEVRRTRLSDRIRNLEIELDREINELDQKMETASTTEKVKWQIRREKLAMEREQLKNDMDKIGTDVSNDWQQLEEDIADRLDRIAQDLRDDN